MPPEEEQLTPDQAGDPHKTAFIGTTEDEDEQSRPSGRFESESAASVQYYQTHLAQARELAHRWSHRIWPAQGDERTRNAGFTDAEMEQSKSSEDELWETLEKMTSALPLLLETMQFTNPEMVDMAAQTLGMAKKAVTEHRVNNEILAQDRERNARIAEGGAALTGDEEGEEPITTPSQYTGGVRGQTFGDSPDTFRDQRPDDPYRRNFGEFTQVGRVAGGIYTAENPPAEMAIDVTRLMDGNVNILVASRNPTGVTSAGLYDGALGYDYLADQPGFTDTPSEGQRNVGRELVREIDSAGNRTGRAVLGSGFRGGAHPTGVAFHIYPMLREGIAAGVDNWHSLNERTNRTRTYTYQDDQGTHEVTLTEGIRNVRDGAYVWTATGQKGRLRVFTKAIEQTDSSLGKDDEGLEKIDANDLRQTFVITLASTGVEAGGDGVIEHIREITGYDAANPTAALATFKEQFQEGMKMATVAGPGVPNRGRGPNAHSIWKAETVDAFFADVEFTIEDGDLYVTMPNRAGTGTIRLRWGRSPSAEAA